MEKNNIYSACDFFLLRKPLLPIDTYKEIFINNLEFDYKKYIDKPEVNEAILITSQNLHKSIIDLETKYNEEKERKVKESLYNYFNRMTTRSTPFGLFATTAFARFGDNTEVNLEEKKENKKSVRVDLKWFYKILKIVEIDKKAYKYVKLYTNKLLIREGSSIRNSFVLGYGKEFGEEGEVHSIQDSENINIVLDMCKDGCYYEEILGYFQKENNYVSSDVIENFIGQLVRTEYIFTELRGGQASYNKLANMINILDRNGFKDPFIEELRDINDRINKYEEVDVGKGCKLYTSLIEKMKKIDEERDYLHIDMGTNIKLKISNEVKDRVTEAINFLFSFSYKYNSNNVIEEYKNRFLERYGFEREIKLVDLLDEVKGLGDPFKGWNENISKVYDEEDTARRDNIKNYFNKLITEAMLKGKKEIILDKSIFDIIKEPTYKYDDMPISGEIYAKVSTKDIESLDKGDYKIFINTTMNSASIGKTFGRFNNFISSEDFNEFYKAKEIEEKLLGKDYIIAELTSLLSNSRFENIMYTKSFRDYECTLLGVEQEGKKQININDIYVAIEKENFYFKIKGLEKKVYFTTNHMLGTDYGNSVYRFIRKINEENRVLLYGLYNICEFNKLRYIPRISYENIVLYPETFGISYNDFFSLNFKNEEKFFREFDRWTDLYKVPKLVYLLMDDKKLLLNLDNIEHKSYIYKELKKNKEKTIILQEYEGEIEDNWLKINNKNYSCELVVPFIKNEVLNKKNEELNGRDEEVFLKNRYKLELESKERYMNIGGEWIYLNLYHNINKTNELISEHINGFSKYLLENGYIKKHFFIRYNDNRNHIRLRYEVNNEKVFELNTMVNSWIRTMIDEELIKDVSINIYERELERYGGIEAIKEVENYFGIESIVVEEYLSLLENKETEVDIEIFAFGCLFNLVKHFGFNFTEQLEMFDKEVPHNVLRKEFSKERKRLMDLATKEMYFIKEMNEPHVDNLVNKIKEAAKILSDNLDIIYKNNKLCNSKQEILSSLIHMFCNRIFGIDKESEKKQRAYIRHTLYALRYIKQRESDINGI